MFTSRLKLPSILGFPVWVDVSWLLVAGLVTWSLATGVFPARLPHLAPAAYWWMAAAGAMGLFASILLHELAHCVVARRFGIPIRGITLFIFGGVAEMAGEPKRPSHELLMAAAGPAASAALAVFFWVFSDTGPIPGIPPAPAIALGYLALMNGYIAAFNLVPAFPLDGGRVLRAALWMGRGDFAWATRIAATVGDLFGLALITWGVASAVTGDLVGGLWRLLIGVFLRNAAAAGVQDAQVRHQLAGVTLADVMTPDPIVVSPQTVITDFLADYVYRHHHRSFPVVWQGRLLGTASTAQVAMLDPTAWAATPVRQVMAACGEGDMVPPDMPVIDALRHLQETGRGRLWVIAQGDLVGVVTVRDLMMLVALGAELPDFGLRALRPRPGRPPDPLATGRP